MEIKQPFLPFDSRFKNGAGGGIIPRQLPLALEPQVPFSIDNFIISPANRTAFEMLEAWPHWPSPVTVLTGGKSSGKSHLAAVWAAQAYAVQCDKTRLDKAVEMAAQGLPVLLEDIDSGPIDETHLFHLINIVRQMRTLNGQAALLVTAQSRPAAWNISLADLASRLKAVNLAEIGEADDILLHAVLSKLFADRQLLVEVGIIRFILNRSERSLAKLAEIVEALDNLALEHQSKITRPLAAEVLAVLSVAGKGESGKLL